MKLAIPSPPLVANCRPCNLRDFLVRARLKPQQQQQHRGSQKCGRPHCMTCASIKTGTSFCSAATGQTYYHTACSQWRMVSPREVVALQPGVYLLPLGEYLVSVKTSVRFVYTPSGTPQINEKARTRFSVKARVKAGCTEDVQAFRRSFLMKYRTHVRPTFRFTVPTADLLPKKKR